MTNEQAIKMLKSKMDGHTDTSYEWAETIRTAIKALEQEPCYDCVSRQAVEDAIETTIVNGECLGYGIASDILYDLPSVTPQPKTGHWIKFVVNRLHKIRCDKCDYVEPEYATYIRNYCPNCGSRMMEAENDK